MTEQKESEQRAVWRHVDVGVFLQLPEFEGSQSPLICVVGDVDSGYLIRPARFCNTDDFLSIHKHKLLLQNAKLGTFVRFPELKDNSVWALLGYFSLSEQ